MDRGSTPVAIFDLDGCLSQTPSRDAITDPDFWHTHFTNGTAECNPEVVDLACTLRAAGWDIMVLTARPSDYYTATRSWLDRFLPDVPLIMWEDGNGYGSSSKWKAQTVKDLIEQGYDVRFMVEDYPNNVEEIRKVVPVLEYQMLR